MEANEKIESLNEIFGNVPKHYSNSTFVTTSVYDIQILFARNMVNPLPGGEEVKTLGEPLVQIQMSPPHFKQFVKILQQQLDTYETNYGKIPEPPERSGGANPSK
jgi:hypothetical protein